ncbi:MAG: hypothetical protein P8Z42_15160 [Anaerolineales bacterium]|jgi:hypothetical protein
MGGHATVKDHLAAIGDSPEWVISLAEMIQKLLGTSSAIASARARDLSRLPPIGKGLESILRGWDILSDADLQNLSPMQKETIEKVIFKILNDVRKIVATTRRMET